ncbi:MAG: SRPBCC domain-containing protein [Acidimicrobiia bacterium]|jgi:hypothetical protein
MTYRIVTEIEIDARPEEVWKHLTDLRSFSEWNPFMIEGSGKVEVGARLKVRMQQPGGSAMTFKPTVTEATAPERFEWLGSLVFPGLFDGRHRFELMPTASGTHLIHSEEFNGVLVPLLRRSLDTRSRAGFETMNQALKARVEDTVHHPA